MKTLVTGGVRSGKSAAAEAAVSATSADRAVVYVATGPTTDDPDWADRIAAHPLLLDELLDTLIAAGLDGLPGAGGEILEDDVRAKAAPARIRSADWFRIIDAAQRKGLYTISTMVIGFGETYAQRARHLLKIREQQDRANALYGGNGFSGFAMWTLQTEHTRLHGKAPGATAHEYLQQLAVARIALDAAGKAPR